jgi:hypothetical protein
VIGGGHAPVFDPTTVDKMLSLKPLVGLGVQSDPATNGGEETILQEEFTDHGCSTFEVTDGLLTKELAGSDLQFNKTVSGTLGEDDYHFFQVCVAKHMHEHELSIVVTTISGEWTLGVPQWLVGCVVFPVRSARFPCVLMFGPSRRLSEC